MKQEIIIHHNKKLYQRANGRIVSGSGGRKKGENRIRNRNASTTGTRQDRGGNSGCGIAAEMTAETAAGTAAGSVTETATETGTGSRTGTKTRNWNLL
ncbi:hypothetical protein [Alistipes finegoldii]|jgi:hypothetical protein|uniref:hypothetical protein n=1 Tax=Alistipes finegoldii TaxID=214856 RepID=UPI00242C4C14|nr:hypothetical protein [Alistipes finegoldii]